MKWWMLLFCLLSAPLSAQRWMHGVLLGGGIGFTHNLEANPECDEYGREGFIYDDMPVHVKVGYTISKRLDVALVYRYGFFNTINDAKDHKAYLDGNLSDLSLSIFVPFVAK